MLVPKEHNAKGVALFLLGYCKLYKIAVKGCEDFGTKEELVDKILANYLAQTATANTKSEVSKKKQKK